MTNNTNLIVLKDVSENTGLVVEQLDLNGNSICFVHDTETDYNYFNQKTMSEIFGVSIVNISKHLNKYLENIENIENNLTSGLKVQINLKTENSNQRVKFYSFDALTYLAYKIDTPEAISYRNTINNMLNKMFNVASGKDDIDTRNVKLHKILNNLSIKRGVYYEASQSLYGICDKKRADEMYHIFKIIDSEYDKIYRLLTDIRINNRDADIVLNQYDSNGRIQQKLII